MKRSIWLSIATLCLCLGVMAFGVYSAVSANLNVSGKLGFSMHDCMVSVSGTIYNLAEMTQDSASANNVPRTIERTIMGGENTTTTNLDIGSMYFFYGANDGNGGAGVYDIIFQLTFTNLTDKTIVATFPKPTVGDSSKITVLDAGDNQEYTAFPYTPTLTAAGETGCSVTVMFALKLTDTTALFSDVNFNWTGIEFEEYEAPDVLQWSNDIGWYIEMGSYNVTSIKWVPIAVSTDNGTTFTEFNGKEYETSNEECKPSGNDYYFISLNMLPVQYGTTSNNYMTWNFYDNTTTNSAQYKAWYYDESSSNMVYYTDTDGNKLDANNYAVSNIRNYLNGETAYRYYDSTSGVTRYQPKLDQKLTPFETLYNLSEDEVWNSGLIQARSLDDLMAKNKTDSYDTTGADSNYTDYDVSKISGHAEKTDKLWLVSHQEYCKFLETNTATYVNGSEDSSYQMIKYGIPLGGTYADYWWFRSAYASNACIAWYEDFDMGIDYNNVYNYYGVRPAFQITIPA